MNAPVPHWLRLVVRCATLLIPPGPVRERYRAEHTAELSALAGGRRAAYALSLLINAPALHRALVTSGTVAVPHSPLWCRLHLHHRWRRVYTDDGAHFRRCAACGRDEDGTIRSGSGSDGYLNGYVSHL